jgi:uncharacterized metal-binding protein YceD (DUF177 family)
MDRSLEKEYRINIARLKYGSYSDSFDVDSAFFEHFEQSPIQGGNVQIDIEIFNYETHLDTKFHLKGTVELACDRCQGPYDFDLDTEYRIIYSYDPDLDFEGYELMFIDRKDPYLSLVQEIYDFVNLSVPFRKVPDSKVHTCPEAVLKLLGLTEDAENVAKAEEIDPRWEALKKLKDKPEN